ncbi:MAG: tetratricopeptide repeat-containing glycosyltransferase family 2 protein [Thermoguttaceae bacterium]
MTTECNCKQLPRLSVAMIVLNEQEVIGQTVENIRSIADEIVVLDCGSEDETAALAGKKGAKVFQGCWKNNFAGARNSCLEKISGDWVLFLDAGEKIEDDSLQLLRQFLNSSASPENVYLMMVEVPPSEPFLAGEQIAQPRLFHASGGLRFEGRVRETLYPAIKKAGLKIELAPGRIIRHPREHAEHRKIRLAERELELLNMELGEKITPEPRLFLAQGEAYIDLGMHRQAEDAFKRAIEISERGSSEMLEGYYGLLTCRDADSSSGANQIHLCCKALEIFHFDAQLLLALGSYLQKRNHLDLAVQAFDAAVKFGKVDLSTWHICELHEVAASSLVIALQLQGKYDAAACALSDALRRHCNSIRLQRLALDLYIKQGKEELAMETAIGNGMAKDTNDPIISAIKGACLAAKQQWTAALAYLQSAYLMDCRMPLCLRWLAVTLLSQGQFESAKSVLDQWQKLEPSNPELLAYLAALQENQTEALEAASSPLSSEGNAKIQYRVDLSDKVGDASHLKIPLVAHPSLSETRISSQKSIVRE